MKITLTKLKAILLYFSNYTDTTYLGKVKLMKLFYFLDFIHVKTYGTPVTFDTYIKLEHGPIPSYIKNLVDNACEDLDESVLADTITCDRPAGIDMYRILPRRKFIETDKSVLKPSEIAVLEQVVARYGDKNTRYVEDASHNEAAYKNSKLLQEIPYTLATEDNDCIATKEEIEFFLSIQK